MFTDNSILELNSMILSKMMRNEVGDWQCNECFQTSNKKQNIMEHIEASHMETPGYNCDVQHKTAQNKRSCMTELPGGNDFTRKFVRLAKLKIMIF